MFKMFVRNLINYLQIFAHANIVFLIEFNTYNTHLTCQLHKDKYEWLEFNFNDHCTPVIKAIVKT